MTTKARVETTWERKNDTIDRQVIQAGNSGHIQQSQVENTSKKDKRLSSPQRGSLGYR